MNENLYIKVLKEALVTMKKLDHCHGEVGGEQSCPACGGPLKFGCDPDCFLQESISKIKQALTLEYELVTQKEWEKARNCRREEDVDPCTHWCIDFCMCKGACSCHWKKRGKKP